MWFSLFPSKSCSSFDEINAEFFHSFGWSWSEKWNFWICSKSANKNFCCSQNIREPMSQWITKSENMNAPSNDVIVIQLIHVFPYKLVMFSQSESMNVKFRTCSKYVSFCARVFELIFGEDFDSHCIDSVMLFVGKVNNNFLETVIWATSYLDWFMSRFIADVTNMGSTKLKELWMGSFLTG